MHIVGLTVCNVSIIYSGLGVLNLNMTVYLSAAVTEARPLKAASAIGLGFPKEPPPQPYIPVIMKYNVFSGKFASAAAVCPASEFPAEMCDISIAVYNLPALRQITFLVLGKGASEV